ncbi:MAG: RNA polymerase sigma factor, partial [Acidobacteria bacterium]|nr:RNA polymerase sigma factor [Acidobacteriota bacterium]
RPRRLPDFESWMAGEQRRVFLLCRRLLQDPEDAACASQDAFLKAFRAWRATGLEEVDDPARWLTRVAANTCLDRLRSRRWQFWRRRPRSEDEAVILTHAADPAPDAETLLQARDIERRLAGAMERLSGRQRAVFALRHFEDRSLEEIAAILDLETGTVKAHLSRALAKLREDLRDLYALHRR